MIYLDTNVMISFMDEGDPNHEDAVKLLESIGERTVSELVLPELASVYSRAGLGNPLSLAIYSIRRVGAELVKLDANQVVREAFKLAPQLRLRTLDLLHIAACRIMGAEGIATLDKGIQARAEVLKSIGIKVLTPGS
jgi:predicted nucleic acid-binding protein